MSRRLLLLAVVVLAAGSPCKAGAGEATPASKTPGASAKPVAESATPLRFLRVLIPADRIQDWPLANTKCLPMDAARFEEMVREAQASTSGEPMAKGARLVSARYQARLTDERSISGQATFEVAHVAKNPVLLPLDPCNLAIGEARWTEPESSPSTLGLADDGKLQLLVERPGRLQFGWSRAAGGLTSRKAFQIEVPACPVSRLDLDLPASVTPALDHGLVLGSSAAGEGLRRWQIELGGHRRFQLRLTEAGDSQQQTPPALVRQSLTYDFSPQGMEVSARMKLEVHHEPLSEISLALDSPLQLVSAEYGNTPVSWSITSPPGSAVPQVVLVLPEPIRDGSGVLTLKAAGPFPAGQVGRLPRMVPQRLFWQEGSATLLVPAPLVIQQLQGIACRQSAVSPLTAPRAGESVQFEYLSADATVQLVLAERPPAVHAVSGIVTELGSGKMTGRVVTDFHVDSGALFSLQAEVTPQWAVDTVESLPAEALDDWTLEPGRPRKLKIRLAKPLTPSRPVRLVIVARRLYVSPGRNLGIDDLVPLRFTSTAAGKRLLALRTIGPYELKLPGDEQGQTVPAASLTAAEVDRFGGAPGDLLFSDDSATRGLRVSLERRKPTYTAVISVEASVSGTALQERYVLDCTPSKSAQMDAVLVRFSQRRAAPPRWSLDGMEEDQPLARPWSARQQAAAGVPAGQETWELSFRRARDAPFKLRAAREVTLEGGVPVSLACMPDAAAQQGVLVIHAFGPQPLIIENRRLKTQSPRPGPPHQVQTARAASDYDPVRDVAADSDPAVLLSLAGAAAVPNAWVWDCELQSQCFPDGMGQHLVRYRLQSAGGGQLGLTLPPAVSFDDVRGLWIDGHRAALRASTGQDHDALVIDLPPGEKFPTVSIHFTTRASRLRTMGTLLPPVPEVDVPVLSRHWTVWLPPGYEAPRFEPGSQTAPERRLTWSQRLFGVLGRGPGQPAFNPLEPNRWRAWPPLEHAPEGTHREAYQPASLPGGRLLPGPAWDTVDLPGLQSQDTSGWTPYRLAIGGSTPAGLAFIHGPTIHALGWLVFLLVSGLGWWRLTARPVLLLALAGALAVVALLASPCCVPVVSGALLGTLFCLGLTLVHRARAIRRPPTAPAEKPELASTVDGIVPFLPVLVAAMLLPAVACGAEAKETIHQVLVPVDARQQPTGGKYYLPEPMYDELHRRAAARREKPQGWLIASAVYRASLAKDSMSQRWGVERFQADFELRVFNAAGRVRIPIHDLAANNLPAEVLLDRRLVQPEWDPDGAAMYLDISEPGEHSLRLTLRPTVRRGDGLSGFELAIPRLATSRLELSVPAGGPAVEVPTAAGSVRSETQSGRLLADLGTADRLAVRWPDDPSGNEAAPAIDLEQLLWLKVQPGYVALDAKLRIKIVTGQLRRLQIAADPGLQLLPLSGADVPAVEVRRPAGQPQIIHFLWANPVSKETVLGLRFLATGISGVGAVPLPQLDVVDAKPIRRWLAVSVDPGLQYQVQAAVRLESLPAKDFSSAWGTADGAPPLAYHLPSGPISWKLSTRPRQPDTAGEQTLALTFDAGDVEVCYDAAMVTAGGPEFQYQLSAPPALQIERVSARAEGADRLARWTRGQDGRIIVFFNGPVSGRHQLSLRGRLPVARNEKMPLPLVEMANTSQQPLTVRIFRCPSVLVALGDVLGLTNSQAPSEGGDPREGTPQPDAPGAGSRIAADPVRADRPRLLCSLSAGRTTAPRATVTVKPNRARVSAEQITRLFWDKEWKVTVECRLHVDDQAKKSFWDAAFDPGSGPRAVLDQICLDVPAACSGPCQSSVPMEIKSVEVPGEGARRLVLRPETPISGDFEFSITGLGLSPSERAAPDIALQQVDQLKRFLVLPRKMQDLPLAWETEGLREAQLPGAPPTGEVTVYEVTGDPSVALYSMVESAPDEGRVRVADIRVAWQADGTCRGTAAFALVPGKLSQCPLWLPEGCRLVYATVGGVPADPLPGERGWLLPLPSDPSIQRVEVVFATGHEILDGRHRFRAPRLGDLAVERTEWTIAGPPWMGPGAPEDAEVMDPGSAPAEGAADREGVWPAGVSAQWQTTLEGSPTITRCAVPGRYDSLTVHYAAAEHSDGTFGGAVLCGSLSALAIVLTRRGMLWQWFVRWPCVFPVTIGLAWWLWLWPSAIGLVIVLAALAWQIAPWLSNPKR